MVRIFIYLWDNIYLYGSNPSGFSFLHAMDRPLPEPHVPQTLTTSFHGRHTSRRSAIDTLLSTWVEQKLETIPRPGNQIPLGRHLFDFPEQCQGVTIVLADEKTRGGIIVAYSPHSINHGPIFTVRFLVLLVIYYLFISLTHSFTVSLRWPSKTVLVPSRSR